MFKVGFTSGNQVFQFVLLASLLFFCPMTIPDIGLTQVLVSGFDWYLGGVVSWSGSNPCSTW